jgi:hypothetical protein
MISAQGTIIVTIERRHGHEQVPLLFANAANPG